MIDKPIVIVKNNHIMQPKPHNLRRSKSYVLPKTKKDSDSQNSDELSISAGKRISRHFEVYEPTGNIMVVVTETDTGKVIKEIPQKELLELKARIGKTVGLVFEDLQ